jgi:hypothetical protein
VTTQSRISTFGARRKDPRKRTSCWKGNFILLEGASVSKRMSLFVELVKPAVPSFAQFREAALAPIQ